MTTEQFDLLYVNWCRHPSFRDALAESDPELAERFERVSKGKLK